MKGILPQRAGMSLVRLFLPPYYLPQLIHPLEYQQQVLPKTKIID
jgi:hypothetical protein